MTTSSNNRESNINQLRQEIETLNRDIAGMEIALVALKKTSADLHREGHHGRAVNPYAKRLRGKRNERDAVRRDLEKYATSSWHWQRQNMRMIELDNEIATLLKEQTLLSQQYSQNHPSLQERGTVDAKIGKVQRDIERWRLKIKIVTSQLAQEEFLGGSTIGIQEIGHRQSSTRDQSSQEPTFNQEISDAEKQLDKMSDDLKQLGSQKSDLEKQLVPYRNIKREISETHARISMVHGYIELLNDMHRHPNVVVSSRPNIYLSRSERKEYVRSLGLEIEQRRQHIASLEKSISSDSRAHQHEHQLQSLCSQIIALESQREKLYKKVKTLRTVRDKQRVKAQPDARTLNIIPPVARFASSGTHEWEDHDTTLAKPTK